MTNNAFYILIGLGWLLFISYWYFSAFSAKKSVSGGWGAFAGLRLFIILLVFLLFHVSGGKNNAYSYTNLAVHNLFVQILGIILFITGLSLAVWARVHIGRNWGMPMSRKVEPELVTSGPYRYVRHPIYSGLLSAILGTALAISLYWLIVFVAAGGYFIYSSFEEEKFLAQQFPKTFPAYKSRTKRLTPFIF